MLSDCFTPQFLDTHPPLSLEEQQSVSSAMNPAIGVLSCPGVVGSSYIEFANTKVISSALEPRSSTSKSGAATSRSLETGHLECKVSFAPFLSDDDVTSPAGSMISRDLIEEQLSIQVTDALRTSVRLECYPKSVLSINVVILQSSIDDLCTAINCASLSLADSGVLLRDIVTSCSFYSPHPEKANVKAIFVNISCMSFLSKLTHVYSQGRIDSTQFNRILHSGQIRCQSLRELMKASVLSKFNSSVDMNNIC